MLRAPFLQPTKRRNHLSQQKQHQLVLLLPSLAVATGRSHPAFQFPMPCHPCASRRNVQGNRVSLGGTTNLDFEESSNFSARAGVDMSAITTRDTDPSVKVRPSPTSSSSVSPAPLVSPPAPSKKSGELPLPLSVALQCCIAAFVSTQLDTPTKRSERIAKAETSGASWSHQAAPLPLQKIPPLQRQLRCT